MPDSQFSVAKLTLPISMVTTIVGGSAWLTTTRGDVNHLQQKVDVHISDFKTQKEKVDKQGEIISKMDGKLDLLIRQLQVIERRLNANHPPHRDRRN